MLDSMPTDMEKMPTSTCVIDSGCDMATSGHCQTTILNSIGLSFIPYSSHECFASATQATAVGFSSLSTPPPIAL